MTFKVNNIQAFIEGLGVICVENHISMPSNIEQRSVRNYLTVKLDDIFIARLNKANPFAMDRLYKLA